MTSTVSSAPRAQTAPTGAQGTLSTAERLGLLYEDGTIKHILAFIKTIASRAHNPQEFTRLKNLLYGDTRVASTTVRHIILELYRSGELDWVYELPVNPREKRSIRGNLADFGISYP